MIKGIILILLLLSIRSFSQINDRSIYLPFAIGFGHSRETEDKIAFYLGTGIEISDTSKNCYAFSVDLFGIWEGLFSNHSVSSFSFNYLYKFKKSNSFSVDLLFGSGFFISDKEEGSFWSYSKTTQKKSGLSLISGLRFNFQISSVTYIILSGRVFYCISDNKPNIILFPFSFGVKFDI